MKNKLLVKIFGFIALFLFLFFILFPINNLRGTIFDKIYKSSGVLLVPESIYFSLLGMPGLGMSNVSMNLPLGDQELDLWSEKVTLKLAFSGLIPPLPGVSVKVSNLKKGGDIYTKITKGGDSIAFYLDAEKINLDQIAVRNGTPPLKGSLNILSDILLRQSDVSKSTGYFKIDGADLKLNQQMVTPPDPSMAAFSFIIPGMKIGKLNGNLNMKNGLLEIMQFKFGEEPSSDFKGSLNGDFRFEKTLEQSPVNIALRLKLSQRILDNPDAKTFISFLNSYQTSPGEYGLKWSATVQDFTNFSIKAIPEKLNN
jgi:type II secretion system protein N